MGRQAIIVGGGHNGLVCACYLASAGFDVTVLERRHILGGAAVTEEFHPGFRNSIASYTVSLLHPKIIQDLNLVEHGLRIVERQVNNYLPQRDGSALLSHTDPNAMHAEIAKFSPADADHYLRFNDSLAACVELIRDLMLERPPALHQTGFTDFFSMLKLSRRLSRLSATDKQTLMRLFSVSAGEMLDDTFESSALKALIGFDAIVGNYASPYQAGSAYVLMHHLLGEVNGKRGTWGHAMGGMGAITQAMADQARQLGVQLETDTTVSEVIVDRGKATGVRLASGETLAADLVVSNLNPALLYLRLIDPNVLSGETLAHFRRYKNQSGSFRMNLALDELPTFSAETPAGALTGGIILSPGLDHMDQAYQDARQHGYSRSPVVEMLIPSLVDDSLAPRKQHVVSLFCQQFNPALGRQWLEQRDNAVNVILDTVEAYAPGIREQIVGMQALSPWDLEQKFGLTGGDIFHGRLSVEQLFSARPMLGAGQYATEIKGLYLCGSGTHPGGGVSGVPGHNAAQRIIGDY